MTLPEHVRIEGLSRATKKGDVLRLTFASKQKRPHEYIVVGATHQLGLIGDARLESIQLIRLSEPED